MELTATQVGEVRPPEEKEILVKQKKELEFIPISNPSSKKNTQKVYHKKIRKYKSISKLKNATMSLLILWMMWNNQWIIADNTLTDCVASGTFVCISFYILNSIDQWIVSWKEGGAYGR